MNKMKLSQNESNEAVCSCDSVCPYLHRLVRKYGNTKINQVKEYKENEADNTADIREIAESIF